MSAHADPKVLIVDDNRAMTRVLRTALEGIGIQRVDAVNDGEAALARLREGAFDLVISDWVMQPLSGFDLLRSIRADEAIADTPFIMVTAHARTDRVRELRESSANAYLLKPFNSEDLKAAISTALAG